MAPPRARAGPAPGGSHPDRPARQRGRPADQTRRPRHPAPRRERATAPPHQDGRTLLHPGGRPIALPAPLDALAAELPAALPVLSGGDVFRSVGSASRAAAGLYGVAGVGAGAAEVGAVVAVGDVGPAVLVGVDAEVVQQLAAGGAVDALLADLPGVYGQDLGGRPAGHRVGLVLREVHIPIPTVRGAVVDEVFPGAGGHDPGVDRLLHGGDGA